MTSHWDISGALLSCFLVQTYLNPVDSPVLEDSFIHLARLALLWARTGDAVAWLD